MLHQIAMQEIFRGYLKKKDKGLLWNPFSKQEWEMNEDWFTAHFEGPGWSKDCYTKDCYENLYFKKVENNWAHRDTTSYKNRDSL